MVFKFSLHNTIAGIYVLPSKIVTCIKAATASHVRTMALAIPFAAAAINWAALLEAALLCAAAGGLAVAGVQVLEKRKEELKLIDYLAKKWGIGRKTLGDRIHGLKDGIEGNPDLVIDKETGKASVRGADGQLEEVGNLKED